MSKQLSQLEEEANVIKNEEDAGANTAERVGQLFVDIVDWLRDYSEESSGGGGGGGGSEFEAFNPILSINNINHNPSTNNQVLVWGTNSWEYRDYLTGGGGGTDLSAVWASLRGYDTDINHKINYSHLTTLTWWGNSFSDSSSITGRIIAPNGFQIGDAVITWDTINRALRISTSVYSDGAVSALGYSSSGGGGGGGGASLNVPISSINSAQLGDPPTPSSGQVYGIVWNGSNWAYGLVGGGSGGGITLQEVWNSFGNNNDTYANTKIHCKHIPTDDSTIVTDTNNNTIGLSTINIVSPVSGDTTYTKVCVDNYGRVIRATTLSDTDIPSLSASKITSGTFDAARIPSSFATQSWVNTQISDMATKTWVGNRGYLTYETYQGTVTSVRVQATSPVTSSVDTAQTTSLSTTISLATAYGDTKNPYGSKTKNYVLAAPSNTAGTPSFRALVAGDIPDLSGTYATKSWINSITWWGRSISNGAVSGDISNARNITMSGYIFMDNDTSLQMKDNNGAQQVLLTLNSKNTFALGYGPRNAGYQTDIQGANINFAVGQSSRINAMNIDNVGRVYIQVGTQGLRIGDGLLTWDSQNNAFKIARISGDSVAAANLYATGGVSALGFTSTINSLESFTISNLATEKIVSSTENSIVMGDLKGDNYLGTSRWNIQTNGYAKFQRLYLDSTRYLHIDVPYSGVYILKYFDGQNDRVITLSS